MFEILISKCKLVQGTDGKLVESDSLDDKIIVNSIAPTNHGGDAKCFFLLTNHIPWYFAYGYHSDHKEEIVSYNGGFDSVGYAHGVGRVTFSGGSVYEGHILHGVFEGKGKFTFENSCIYEGDFKWNTPHGWGKYRSVADPDGEH